MEVNQIVCTGKKLRGEVIGLMKVVLSANIMKVTWLVVVIILRTSPFWCRLRKHQWISPYVICSLIETSRSQAE